MQAKELVFESVNQVYYQRQKNTQDDRRYNWYVDRKILLFYQNVTRQFSRKGHFRSEV
jgi:hypothetical protein